MKKIKIAGLVPKVRGKVGMIVNIEVSVILISYNKYPENLFTLYSLENQNYPKEKLEVLLIDDCSTDETRSLKDYQPAFHFKYIKSPQQLGRAGAKNLGIREARGKVLIFLDAEVLVDANFISNHLKHFVGEKEVAVSGTANHYSTYSILYPQYSRRQIAQLHSLVIKEPLYIKQVARMLKIPKEEVLNFKRFFKYVRRSQQKIPLLNKKTIKGELYKKLAFPKPSFPRVLDEFGNNLTGYHFPWTFFITRNVSVRKSSLERVGLFNEEFRGWGYEDWELGYRLFKNGVPIIEEGNIYSYHQEHPYSKENRERDKFKNYVKLVEIHSEIEAATLILGILGKISFEKLNKVINEYYQLASDFPHQYDYIIETFNQVTRAIPQFLSQGRDLNSLYSGIDMKKILSQLEELKKYKKYDTFVKAFKLLL